MSNITICPPQPNPKHTHQMKGKHQKAFRKSSPPSGAKPAPIAGNVIDHHSSKRTREEAEELLSKALKGV